MLLSVGRIRFIFSLFVILPPTNTQLRPTNLQNLARFEKTYIFDHFDFTTECFFQKIAKIRKMETFSNFLLQIMILRLSFLEKPAIEIDKI